MNFIKKWWLKINHLSPCPNVAEPTRWLIEYIPPGNIEDLAAWIAYNIKWTKDKGPADEWKPPARTIAERRGDCEDLARVAQAVVATWNNWQADIVYLNYLTPPNHVVCAFTDPNGQKSFFEGKIIYVEKYSEIADFFRRQGKIVCSAWYCYANGGFKKSLDND